MSLHALAETLHKCVYELEDMPTGEYMDWIRYMDERQRQREAEDGNLLAMEADDMIGKLTE
jgi:hypothetical protein